MNPGCPIYICRDINGDDFKNTTVIHVKADGPSNSLHYIWDLRANHTPSVLVALTELNTSLIIEWESFLNSVDTPNTVAFSNEPVYTMTFLFTKVSYIYITLHILSCNFNLPGIFYLLKELVGLFRIKR